MNQIIMYYIYKFTIIMYTYTYIYIYINNLKLQSRVLIVLLSKIGKL